MNAGELSLKKGPSRDFILWRRKNSATSNIAPARLLKGNSTSDVYERYFLHQFFNKTQISGAVPALAPLIYYISSNINVC